MDNSQKVYFMSFALQEAKIAFRKNEVPIGCVVVSEDKIIGRGHNQVISNKSINDHAEIVALNEASKHLKNYRLDGCILFTTIEPCHMCASAISQSRISKIFFGATEPKTGSIVSIDRFFDKKFLNHRVSFSGGILERECSDLMKKFFRQKRKKRF